MTDSERTRWQRIQDSKIRRIETKLKELPTMIAEAVRLGPLYEVRKVIDELDCPPQPKSLRKHAVTTLAELEYALDCLKCFEPGMALCERCEHDVNYHDAGGCLHCGCSLPHGGC